MRRRFATQIHNGWDNLDWRWLRDVTRNAHWLWVRIQGLSEISFRNHNDPEVIAWQEAACRLTPVRVTPAYLLVSFGFHGRHMRGPFPRHAAITPRRWERSMIVHQRLLELLRLLREMQPHRMGMFVEDFSARWLQATGFVPDLLVADNPMVGLKVARTLPLWRVPGFVRASHWPALGRLEFWELPFPEEMLLASHMGISSRLRHAHWRRSRLLGAELDACRRERPILAEPLHDGAAAGEIIQS